MFKSIHAPAGYFEVNKPYSPKLGMEPQYDLPDLRGKHRAEDRNQRTEVR